MSIPRRRAVVLSSFGLLISSFSCAPLVQPKVNGLTATDAQAIAILSVRTAERNYKLELEPFDTHPTPKGNYTVSLQSKTSSTTADHWRVIVHPDRSAEVVPADPAPTEPRTMHANPTPLQGDTRMTTPPAPEPVRPVPHE